MKTVAYLRVSTPQQDASSQRLAILEYARKHDLHIDDFIEATASGPASEKRRRLDEPTSVLQRGGRLVVSGLSRLGRDPSHRPAGRHQLDRHVAVDPSGASLSSTRTAARNSIRCAARIGVVSPSGTASVHRGTARPTALYAAPRADRNSSR